MFSFDEELFKNSCSKVEDSISKVSNVSSLVDEVIALSSDLDVDVSEVKGDINDVQTDLESLNGYITNTVNTIDVLKKLDENYSAFGSDGIDDEEWEELLTPTSPFTIGIDGEYGSSQSNAYELFIDYLVYKVNVKENEKYNSSDRSDSYMITETEEKQAESIINLFKEKGFEDNGIEDEMTMLDVLRYEKNQGCGHAAITNYVCEIYSDKPEEFEEKYGYPLYVEKDGHMTYNYETIMTDVFLDANDKFLSDNITAEGFVANNEDSSIHVNEMGDKLSHFLGEEVETVVVSHDASTETYNNYIEDGYEYSVMAAYRFDLNAHGETEKDYSANKETQNGHWMTITGVSENNKLLLSSWGREYELEHTDLYALLPVDGVQKENEDDECMIFFRRKKA